MKNVFTYRVLTRIVAPDSSIVQNTEGQRPLCDRLEALSQLVIEGNLEGITIQRQKTRKREVLTQDKTEGVLARQRKLRDNVQDIDDDVSVTQNELKDHSSNAKSVTMQCIWTILAVVYLASFAALLAHQYQRIE